MTLDALLELVRAARRSPHARRVLHDALLESGPAYARALENAISFARSTNEPVAVVVNARSLQSIPSADAFDVARVSFLRGHRRAWRRGGPVFLADRVTVVVVRPPKPEAEP